MTRVEKIENIMRSNLSDEMKEELVKSLFERDEKPVFVVPYQVTYPTVTPYLKESKPWWDQVTCKGESSKREFPETWDDEDWWTQHLRNAQADVESIVHPSVTFYAKQ